MKRVPASRSIFCICNYGFLAIYALAALLPLVHLFALSLSLPAFAEAGQVGLFPKGFTWEAYRYILDGGDYVRAFFNSIFRLVTGVPLNMAMICLAAYPLSRPGKNLRFRSVYSWFFVITMLVSGGMVPMFMLVSSLHLKNTILALILPGAVPVYSVVLMINFFRQVPEGFHEAAEIDGANEASILVRIYLPLSVPAFLTLTLFSIVSQWNSWTDGILYMSTIEQMPLQAYLQSVVIAGVEGNIDNVIDQNYVSQATIDAARLFLAVIPVALMYFPLQKYFIQGMTIGGIKG